MSTSSRGKYENQPGEGVLFPVKEKRHEKGPDLEGFYIVDEPLKPGDHIKLASWRKKSAYGEFLTLRINRYQPKPPREVGLSDDDSVPF